MNLGSQQRESHRLGDAGSREPGHRCELCLVAHHTRVDQLTEQMGERQRAGHAQDWRLASRVVVRSKRPGPILQRARASRDRRTAKAATALSEECGSGVRIHLGDVAHVTPDHPRIADLRGLEENGHQGVASISFEPHELTSCRCQCPVFVQHPERNRGEIVVVDLTRVHVQRLSGHFNAASNKLHEPVYTLKAVRLRN